MDIFVRHAEHKDCASLYSLFAMPKVIAGTLHVPFSCETYWQKRIVDKSDSGYFLVAEVDGELRGSLSLVIANGSPRRRHSASIGMAVHDDWQGKGIGGKLLQSALDLAENWLGLSRIELTVFTDNDTAIALYKKYDFEIEGTLRKFALKSGIYCDVYSMARLLRSNH
ncbi:MAG: GNAT family N-acetyltransferase [Pseudomonadota bacterium]